MFKARKFLIGFVVGSVFTPLAGLAEDAAKAQARYAPKSPKGGTDLRGNVMVIVTGEGEKVDGRNVYLKTDSPTGIALVLQVEAVPDWAQPGQAVLNKTAAFVSDYHDKTIVIKSKELRE